jgi:hypothetical protein
MPTLKYTENQYKSPRQMILCQSCRSSVCIYKTNFMIHRETWRGTDLERPRLNFGDTYIHRSCSGALVASHQRNSPSHHPNRASIYIQDLQSPDRRYKFLLSTHFVWAQNRRISDRYFQKQGWLRVPVHEITDSIHKYFIVLWATAK